MIPTGSAGTGRAGLLAAVATGCTGPPDVRPPEPVALEALRIVGDGGVELDEVRFVPGAAGGFFAEVGLAARTPTGAIGLGVELADGSSDPFASSEGNYALAGWTERHPVGWMTTTAWIGDRYSGSDALSVACGLDGAPVVVTACARELTDGTESCVTEALPAWFDDVYEQCP